MVDFEKIQTSALSRFEPVASSLARHGTEPLEGVTIKQKFECCSKFEPITSRVRSATRGAGKQFFFRKRWHEKSTSSLRQFHKERVPFEDTKKKAPSMSIG